MLFADDTNLTEADNDYNQVLYAMNCDLNTLKSWLDANKLGLDADFLGFHLGLVEAVHLAIYQIDKCSWLMPYKL